MTMSDPIADMLTRIRNANTAKHDTVDVPSSKMKLAIADILVKEGYIKKYDLVEDGAFQTIRITLKYGKDKNEKIITGIKRISKPGLRVYANKEELPKVHGMSRIGRMPIAIPAGVTVTIAENNKVTVKGPKGTLERVLPAEMSIKEEDGQIIVTRPSDLKKMKSLHGLTRTLINNMIVGVTAGYEKKLEINGVGYRAQKQGKKLVLSLGYSHPVEMEDPEGLESTMEGQNVIIVKGIDKEKVGQYAAEIRDKRRPEPYKGKGIKYADEVIRRKVGKTGKK